MRRCVLALITVVTVFSCQQQPSYKVEINFSDKPTGMLYLMKEIDKKPTAVDSIDLSNENIVFTGQVETPELYYLKLNDQKKMLRLFLDNSKIDILMNPDSVDKAEVTGSVTHYLYKQFVTEANKFDVKHRALYSDYQKMITANDEAGVKLLEEQMEDIYNQQQAYFKSFVDSNPESVVSLYIVKWHLIYELDYQGLNDILVKSPTTTTSIYNALKDRLAILEKVQVGKQAIDFSMEDSEGKLITLSDFRGKHLLIDFWASWCPPCRIANPNLVETYKKYNELGFEVLGVSLDNNREQWLEAIKVDNLTWKHVSDLKGWQNAVGQLYGINSIPHTILVDKEGIIIGNRLSHEELDAKLDEIFNQ